MSVMTFGSMNTSEIEVGLKYKPLDNGYYLVPLGGLNAFNSIGEFYVFDGDVKELFADSGVLMKNIAGGFCASEVDHPPFTPDMTVTAWLDRLAKIDLKNICANIRRVYVEEKDFCDEGARPDEKYIAIYGEVKPTEDELGKKLLSRIKDKDSNCSFSIRGYSNLDTINGRRERRLYEIFTWDWVLRPGIKRATKWSKKVALEECNAISINLNNEDEMKLLKTGIAGLIKTAATESSKEIFMSIQDKLNARMEEEKPSAFDTW